MDSKSKKVLIIGAGRVGLIFLKTMLQDGHNVLCFERQDKVGGMWNMDTGDIQNGYVDLDKEGGVEAAYSELRMNSSKYTEYASYDPPDDAFIDPRNHFLKKQEYLEWVQRSAVKFNLTHCIKLNTEVTQLNKEHNGWNVSYKNPDNKNMEEHFDFVISCIGFRYPSVPKIENLEKFKGIAIHSGQLRNEDLFSSQTVLVTGASHSGTDMAYWALKKNAKKVFLSVQKGGKRNYWVVESWSKQNPPRPRELGFNRYLCYDRVDLFFQKVNSEAVPLYKCSPDAEVALPPDTVAVSDTTYLTEQLALCNLEVVDTIKSFTETGAKCKDGSILNGIDVVVFASGFLSKYPWLSHIWDDETQDNNELYNFFLPTEDNLQGLAFATNFGGISSFASVYELQARWLCTFWLSREYTESGSLYSQEEMQRMKEAIEDYKAPRSSGVKFGYVPDFYKLADSLAQDVGCLPPNYKELLKTGSRNDVELGIGLMYLPIHTAMQYRLRGKGMFQEAPQFVINLTKYVIGEDEFEKMVDEAIFDVNLFFKKYGISDEKFIPKPYMKPFLK